MRTVWGARVPKPGGEQDRLSCASSCYLCVPRFRSCGDELDERGPEHPTTQLREARGPVTSSSMERPTGCGRGGGNNTSGRMACGSDAGKKHDRCRIQVCTASQASVLCVVSKAPAQGSNDTTTTQPWQRDSRRISAPCTFRAVHAYAYCSSRCHCQLDRWACAKQTAARRTNNAEPADTVPQSR